MSVLLELHPPQQLAPTTGRTQPARLSQTNQYSADGALAVTAAHDGKSGQDAISTGIIESTAPNAAGPQSIWTLSANPMRIIAEKHLDHWTAWLAEKPCQAFGGDEPTEAVQRLCQANELDCTAIGADNGRCHDEHLEFVFGTECPDCGGSGEYIGLNAVEDCRTCGGSGH